MSIRAFVWIALGLLSPVVAQAQDRVGSVGQSLSFPIQFEPTSDHSTVYNLDLGFSYSERWWVNLSWETGIDRSDRMNLAFGGRFYLWLPWDVKPFVGVSFLYSIDPQNDIGWRAGLGLDYDLIHLTGNNNLRFELFSGASSYIINNSPDIYAIEAARVGLSWNY